MKSILVSFTPEFFPREPRLKIILVPDSCTTWRDMQKFFDAGYHYDFLKFWPIGEEIKNA